MKTVHIIPLFTLQMLLLQSLPAYAEPLSLKMAVSRALANNPNLAGKIVGHKTGRHRTY